MANNPKKGPFDLSVDLDKIPGYKSRFNTLDSLGNIIKPESERVSITPAVDQHKNLRQKFNSGQDPHTLPSTILRRKGVRV